MTTSNLKYDQLATLTGIGTSTFKDIWVNTQGDILVREALFQFNTNNIILRVEADAQEIFNLNLQELKNDFKLRAKDSWPVAALSLFQYADNRWSWQPPEPLRVDLTVKIQAKSISGTKQMERGLIVWGTQ